MTAIRCLWGGVGGEELAEVRGLLEAAFGDDLSADDWDHTLGGWHVLVEDGGRLVAHAALVPRRLEVGGRLLRAGYVEGVATVPDRTRQGLATLAMRAVGEVIRARVALGALSTGHLGFYARLGWERWEGPTFVREHGVLRRTADEDDGIMVLPTAATRGLDRRAPLTCDARRGDDW